MCEKCRYQPGTRKIDIKRVTFNEEECEESQKETEPSIRTMRLMERDNSNINKLEQRLKKTEVGLEETRAMVKDILKIVSKSPPMPVSPVMPRPENNKDPNWNYECFRCGELGHFARNCPNQSRNTSSYRNRSRSPSPRRDLNSNWLKM